MNPRYHQRLQHARARIARSRRRVDRDATRLAMRAQLAFDWRSLITRRPLMLLAGAVGVGLAASAWMTRSGNWPQWLSAGAGSSLWKEIIALAIGGDKADEDEEEIDADDSKE